MLLPTPVCNTSQVQLPSHFLWKFLKKKRGALVIGFAAIDDLSQLKIGPPRQYQRTKAQAISSGRARVASCIFFWMKALSTLLKSKKLDRKKTIPTHQQRRHQCHKQQVQDQACDQQHGDLHTFQLLETLLLLLHPLESGKNHHMQKTRDHIIGTLSSPTPGLSSPHCPQHVLLIVYNMCCWLSMTYAAAKS